MAERDYVIEQVCQSVSKQTKVNQLEVDKAINLTFKGINEMLTEGVKQVKVPYLGLFRRKKNLLTESDNDNGRLNNRS